MNTLDPQYVPLSGAQKFTRLLAGVPHTRGMKSGYVTLQPGESVGEHKTEAREEAVVILEGTASVYCEGKHLFNAQAQSLVYIPPEKKHDIKNEGKEMLRYVYIVTPVKAE